MKLFKWLKKTFLTEIIKYKNYSKDKIEFDLFNKVMFFIFITLALMNFLIIFVGLIIFKFTFLDIKFIFISLLFIYLINLYFSDINKENQEKNNENK